jgi:hypothetical protein
LPLHTQSRIFPLSCCTTTRLFITCFDSVSAAPPPPPLPPFSPACFLPPGLFLRARLRTCRWASAVTRRPTPSFFAAGAGRPAPSLRRLTYHSTDEAVNIFTAPIHTCRAGPSQARAEISCHTRRRRNNYWNLRRYRRVATAIDSNSPKVHRREDLLAAAHIKPYTSSFLLHSCKVVHHMLRQRLRPPPPPFFSHVLPASRLLVQQAVR